MRLPHTIRSYKPVYFRNNITLLYIRGAGVEVRISRHRSISVPVAYRLLSIKVAPSGQPSVADSSVFQVLTARLSHALACPQP